MNHANLRRLRDLEDKVEELESIVISIQAHISARLKEEATSRRFEVR